jgi:hypothetical protein
VSQSSSSWGVLRGEPKNFPALGFGDHAYLSVNRDDAPGLIYLDIKPEVVSDICWEKQV